MVSISLWEPAGGPKPFSSLGLQQNHTSPWIEKLLKNQLFFMKIG
jgi:hypothetical protein